MSYTASAIRDLAPSFDGDLFLAALFERTVYLWNMETGNCLSEFPTVMDSGGERLVLSQKHSVVLAAAYERHGLACYGLPEGRLRWQRRDLKKIQAIRLDPDEQLAYCCFDERPCYSLSLEDGRTVGRIQRVRDIWLDRYNGLCLEHRKGKLPPKEPDWKDLVFHPRQLFSRIGRSIDRRFGGRLGYPLDPQYDRELCVVDSRRKEVFRIEPEGFDILDVAFSREYLAVSEAGGPLRIFALSSGREILRHSWEEGWVLQVASLGGGPVFHGVHNCDPLVLLRFTPGSKEPETIRTLGPLAAATAFCRAGAQLITSDGELIDCRTGQTIGQFAFPQAEYPDEPE